MPRFWHSRTWRVGRVCFRWLRISGWLLLLTLVSSLVYVNQVGLPDFLKRRLVEELRSRGIELQYEQMRLDFYGGLVAEKVRFGSVDDTNAPSLFIESVGLQLDPERLYQSGRVEIDSLVIQGGRLSLPLSVSNAPMTNLVVEAIEGRVSLLAGDVWQVQELKARSLGLRLQMTGTVTNASALQDWKLDTDRGLGARSWREYLRRAMAVAGRLQFTTPPVLKGYWRLNAADPMRALARLELNADGAHTPWGDADEFGLKIRLVPATGTGEILGAQIDLRMAEAVTPWGRARELTLRTQTRPVEQTGAWPGAGLTIEAAAPDTRWGSAESMRLDFTLADVQTNLTGFRGQVQLAVQKPKTKWASAEVVKINAHAAQLPVARIVATDANWGWWADLAPFELDWQLTSERVVTDKGELDRLEARGHWRAPDLAVDELTAGILGGKLRGALRVNVENREATGQAAIDFDIKKLRRLLPPGALEWLEQIHWDLPPIASARAGAKLPPWTAGQVDWRVEVLPTLWLAGTLTNQTATFRDLRFDRARLDFQFTNQAWRLRDVVVERPEGRLELEGDADERTKDFSLKIHSSVDLKLFRPLLDETGQEAFDLIEFKSNPDVEMELRGRWSELERTGVDATVRLTNFSFRGETADELSVALTYTNRLITFRDVHLRRPEGEVTVASGLFDLTAEHLFLTNVVSSIDPMPVLRAIGPSTAAAIEPYQFLAPPKVRVSGLVHTGDVKKMDLQFHVEGGPFRWSRFNLPQVAADLHWVHNGLLISNLAGAFYDGKITGSAQFDFAPPGSTDFGFTANVWESDAKKLLTDLTGKSNQLEGVLNGQLNVLRANSSDWTSWQGFGDAKLRDGLIWDVPLFGFLTAPLNLVMPGLGYSRASAATATYTITNSVIHTGDLDIIANSLRLKYRGKVDFDTKVNARVEVEFLRDTGMLGKFFNLALLPLTRLFDYKLTGTLADPKPEPLYILPKVILFPLQPIKTIKDLFPGETPSAAPASTNAPAVPAPTPVLPP